MIPDGVLSTVAQFGPFVRPVRSVGEYLSDYELAGVALRDGTRGMQVRTWVAYVMESRQVWVSAPGVAPSLLFTRGVDIQELALAFDNNMNPFVAFREGALGTAGSSYIWWFDSTDSTQKFTALPAGVVNPRCCVDDHRASQSGNSDVVLSYIRAGSLYARYQRERYVTEHLLRSGLGTNAELVDLSMNRVWRLQWRLRNTLATPGAAVFAYPFVGDVVKDLAYRAGLPREAVDVSELYDDHIVGYPVSTDDDVASQLEPLSQAFFFDPTEYDRVLRFLPRGRNSVGRFTYEDLVDRDPGAFKQTVIQEDKLPKQVEISHLDPDGGYSRNTQRATRKSNMVKAKGNEEVDLPFTATADQAATIALKRIKMHWHEPVTYEFWLTVAFTEWVPTDSVEYLDEDNNLYYLRIETRNEDTGVLKFTAKKDGRGPVYGTQAVGLPLPPPISTTPGLVGETRLEILNIPVLRDQDDELGVYIAVAGSSSAWYGADVLISTDGGVNYYDAFTTEQPGTIGDTETDLRAEISSEYGDNQSVIVKCNYGLESVSYESMLNNYNRCVIGDEVLQFQTAAHLGDNRYLLTGLVRGRYNTVPEAWPAGTRFVLLDSTVFFLQAQQWMIGKEIYLKPVSYGLTEDESTPTAYDYDVAVSQTEWPPHYVRSTRDGSDSVTVTFIPRPRLGIETAPNNSKYFTGYKVQFSDGFSALTTATTYTRASTPPGATVKVCGVNSITGDGEYSEEIPT